MRVVLVVTEPRRWPLAIPNVEVISATEYLAGRGSPSGESQTRVFNLCRSYRYQSAGYYVSLLAAARGHRPVPDIGTIRDLQTPVILRLVSAELDDLIQQSLKPLRGESFQLSIYFGGNLAQRYERLSRRLFDLFTVPFLRAEFRRTSKWQLQSLNVIAVEDIPEAHREFAVQRALAHFSGRRRSQSRRHQPRYDLAILHRPDDAMPPSDGRALNKFMRAAARLRIAAELITKDDFGRLPQFDALFIRETTAVTDHTFLFSRRAEAEGLVVIDDPTSILRCCNKVYLAELLARHRIAAPATTFLRRDNLAQAAQMLSYPCVLKQPDSSFSLGVSKVADAEELIASATKLLAKSDLILAQEFVPTAFDWRIGILDGQAVYASKYYMARNHWQICQHIPGGRRKDGRVESVPIAAAPPAIVAAAVKVAKLIGNGLYGVDLKEIDDRAVVVEINDNPSLDSGCEDQILGDALYDTVMRSFLTRLDTLRGVPPQ